MNYRSAMSYVLAILVALLPLSQLDAARTGAARRKISNHGKGQSAEVENWNGAPKFAIFGKGGRARRATKNKMLKNVAESWNGPSIWKFRTGNGEPTAANPCSTEVFYEKNSVPKRKPIVDFYENALLDKVSNINIQKIRFIEMPLSRVVESLASVSESGENGVVGGVNFVLIGLQKGEPEPTVTLNLKNISLYRVIELVAKYVSYKFDVTKDAVIFYKNNSVDDIVEMQFFPVSRATLIRLTGTQGINHHGQKNLNFCENIADEERAIKDFFQRAGVDFIGIPGSSLAFDGSQIIVANTGRNLKKINNILKKYAEVKQVEIEAKFLEVQQSALDELGFKLQFENKKNKNSAFFHTWNSDDGKSSTNLRSLSDAFAATNFSRGDGKIIQMDQNNQQIQSTISNRPPGLPGQIALGESSNPLSLFSGIFDKLKFNAIILALEQHHGSDLMSAPKLTVLSGKTAEIVIAMELRYPEKYGDTHSEVGSGTSNFGASSSAGVTITSGTPQNFAMRNVGVEMSVTPTVEDDGSISLQLEPRVTEFEGFVEYGGVNVAISAGTTVTVPSGFYQPIFSTREIRTEVNVLDGATVIMGGLTREEVKEVDDKIPILGDIPIFGRLFRSKSETTQKRNLLIFVTARTVSPVGNDGGGEPEEVIVETEDEPKNCDDIKNKVIEFFQMTKDIDNFFFKDGKVGSIDLLPLAILFKLLNSFCCQFINPFWEC
jgi:general secretion pathway protein D